MHHIYHTCSWENSVSRGKIHFPYHAVSGHFPKSYVGFNHGGLRAVCSLVMSWVPIGTDKPEIQPCRGPSRLRNRANLLVLKFGPIHELFSYHVAKKPIVPL